MNTEDKNKILTDLERLSNGVPIYWKTVFKHKKYLAIYGNIPNIKKDDFVLVLYEQSYMIMLTNSKDYEEILNKNIEINKPDKSIEYEEFFKMLICKYCKKPLIDLPYIKALDGLISHPQCFNEYCNRKAKPGGKKIE